jgi:hypothetical protein
MPPPSHVSFISRVAGAIHKIWTYFYEFENYHTTRTFFTQGPPNQFFLYD